MRDADSNRKAGQGPHAQPSHGNLLRRAISHISQRLDEDAEIAYHEEAVDNNGIPSDGHRTSFEEGRKRVVAWEPDDVDNPHNWSKKRKGFILFTTMCTVINSTIGSSLPSNAIPFIATQWGINSTAEKVLPISTFLTGYVFGPILWAPLSEQFGRRWITMVTFMMFCLWTLACALAPSWPAFLVFRLFVGIFASAPIAVVTGIVADIYPSPQSRGRAMAAFMATTVFGPLLAPIIGGFASPTIGWRWTFWIGLVWAALSAIPLLLLRETYAPVLLVHRARRLRKEGPPHLADTIIAAHERIPLNFHQLATRVLTRPLAMLVGEPIVTATCAYLALVYAIFYMTFEAFPIIYVDLYGLSLGVEGLCFLPIGLGALCALPVFFAWDAYLKRAVAEGRAWTRREEYRRLPLACLGGPLFVVSLFWLGWSARMDVPFYAPMFSGVPFGMGFMLTFMALLNYLTDAYEIYAASANAAASCSRSLLATVLPFASAPMFARMGIAGACSLLGGLSCLMCVIPFVFIWKGEKLREASGFCRMLRAAREATEKEASRETDGDVLRTEGPNRKGVGESSQGV
ncbi:unnamed protein product [Discula destructiva]